MHCPNCGNPIESDDLFCGECGHKIEKKSKAVHSAESEISNAESKDSINDSTSSYNEVTNVSKQQDKTQANQNSESDEPQSTHNVERKQVSSTPHQSTNEHQRLKQHHTPTHEHYSHNSNQSNRQQTSQFSEHAKEVTQESKGFFKSAFVSPDQMIKNDHSFSLKLIFSLIIAGLLIIALVLGAVIPTEIIYIGTSKGTIILSSLIGIVFFLAILVGATYLITRIVVRQPISFKKVLSDYVLINSVSIAIMLISIVLYILHSYRFASFVFILSIILLIVSGVYLIAKYSATHETRISSFYGVIIFIFITFIFVSIFGESFFNQIFGNMIDRLGEIFDGGMNY
ncbi:DUF2116 family Zn-ribbon domain-containing protein [Staphylococcus capitis]|uniref:zinc ribbon domain-containing protein n=1 Tax=Staphylococcus capitis TaxID=29388 RepID=UPI0036A10772